MRRALTLHRSFKQFTSNPCSSISDNLKSNHYNLVSLIPVSASTYTSKLRFLSSSSENDSTNTKSSELSEPKTKDPLAGIVDVSDKDLKLQLEEYFKHGKEEILPTIFQSILKRTMLKKHENTDSELIDELQMKPLDDVNDQEFEAGLDEAHQTDDEIQSMCDARDIVVKRMTDDPYFNMNEHKWDEMVQEAVEKGFMKDTKECEDIIEDMLKWDNLLPDDVKKNIEKKFNEIEDRVENGEFTPEEGYALFKEFEDKMKDQVMKEEEAAAAATKQFDTVPDNKKDQGCDPPGEGPVLRWQSQVVFVPGGNAWHPKNRKVKMSVTVKELCLSKHQFRRLRELVGKRYNPGKDELTLTSERFEHREENRKDCLRTLYALIDEARKADKLVEDARTSYVKERLKSNPQFMEKLRAKVLRSRECLENK